MDTRGRHLTMNINMGLNKLLLSSTVWSYSDEDRLVVWSNMTDFFWRIMKHKWFYIVKKQHILLARCAVLCTMPKTKTCKTQKSFKWYIPYVYCGYFTTELLSSITLTRAILEIQISFLFFFVSPACLWKMRSVGFAKPDFPIVQLVVHPLQQWSGSCCDQNLQASSACCAELILQRHHVKEAQRENITNTKRPNGSFQPPSPALALWEPPRSHNR